MTKEKSEAEARFLALKKVLEKKKWELEDREWEQRSMAKELAARNEVLDEREAALRKREAEVAEKEVELAAKLGVDVLMLEEEQETEIDESDFFEVDEQDEETDEESLPPMNNSIEHKLLNSPVDNKKEREKIGSGDESNNGKSRLPSNDDLPKTIVLSEVEEYNRPPTSGQFQIVTKARDPEFYYKVYKMLYNKRREVREFSPENIDALINSLNSQIKKISNDIRSLGIFSEDQMGEKVNEETFHRRVIQVVLFDIKTDLISGRITINELLPFEEVKKILERKFK